MSVAETYSVEFAGFERYKKTLLDHLRSAYELGPKSKNFDQDHLWHRLRGAAGWVFQRRKKRTVLPARRKERLRDLAKAVRRARVMAEKAMQDDVGGDLFSGWCAEAKINPAMRNIDEIKVVVASLAALVAAASRAATICSRNPARQVEPGFCHGDINALMAVYRSCTGLEPSMVPDPLPIARNFSPQ